MEFLLSQIDSVTIRRKSRVFLECRHLQINESIIIIGTNLSELIRFFCKYFSNNDRSFWFNFYDLEINESDYCFGKFIESFSFCQAKFLFAHASFFIILHVEDFRCGTNTVQIALQSGNDDMKYSFSTFRNVQSRHHLSNLHT